MKVVRVLDADTYSVQMVAGVATVRLVGVDAPEAGQPFGRQATDSVRARVLGKYVLVRAEGLDAYRRNLGQVKLQPVAFGPARAVALDSLLVVRGWAWAYAPGGAAPARAGQELLARNAGRGLWKCGTAEPIRPAIWRVYTKQEKLLHWGACAW
ncbi:thermonuclease family protein [Hymenobacter sp. BT664]|uniref:Thermonuclease family protein n=1 Tax=Hymenobacter montanus TaxID=2771359 RepID=A0A927BE91_9BACT|nr:thermonuclease family protein [Hymenobacter montanus]